MKKVSILNIPFLNIDQKNFTSLLLRDIKQKKSIFVVTANPEIVIKATEDNVFKSYIEKATYITADGIGIVKAANMLGEPLPGRVTGYDTVIGLFESKTPIRVYLLGAEDSTLQKAVQNIQEAYPHITIVGAHHGFFDWEDEKLTDEIINSTPELVLLALGAPRQEKWIAENIKKFDYGVFMGVGGTFDVIAGTVKRAPAFWVNLNLEWLYRIISQPTRLKRAFAIPKFMLTIWREKSKK